MVRQTVTALREMYDGQPLTLAKPSMLIAGLSSANTTLRSPFMNDLTINRQANEPKYWSN